MTEQRIDHAAEAHRVISTLSGGDSLSEAYAYTQVHATLALVEQQREANDIARAQARIALGQFRVGVNDLPHLRHLVVQPVGEYDIGPTPEVAAALGLTHDAPGGDTKETNE